MKDELLLAEEKAWNCTNMIVGVDLITRSVVSQSFAAPTFM